MKALVLPPLGYDFGALAPVIIPEIMEIHYTKHHAAYVNNFNIALEKADDFMRKDDLPALLALQGAMRFNGGGHINHSLFWPQFKPKSQFAPLNEGALKHSIERDFGSVEQMIEKLSAASGAIQGSGWGWLAYDRVTKELVIATCANQDPLKMLGLEPIFGIDVWEHAYYLQYKNVRGDYVKKIWEIVDWKVLEERYHKASS